jgi:endonuclease YncB( thermonuclease family)
MINSSILLVAFLLFARPALADSFTGRVVRIADGDTLTVLVDRTRVKIRLTEIDAPESGQAYGQRSKQSLTDLCAAKTAHVQWFSKDRYGRTLGRVTCESVDANTEQVRRGMAWVFDRYVTDLSLYKVQEQARAARVGLWADAHPVSPWEWRKARRDGSVKVDTN